MSQRMLGDLAGAHLGRPILVMGGGPGLPDEAAEVEHLQPLRISANGHGCRLQRDLGLRMPEYIVAVDDRHRSTGEPMEPILRQWGVTIIGRQAWADIRLPDALLRGITANAGMWAIAVAAVLGGAPILVAGIDCYQGPTYWHDAEAESCSRGRPLEDFLDRMRALRAAIDPAPVRVLGGPLGEVWPEWSAEECLGQHEPAYALIERAEQAWRGVRLRIVRRCWMGRVHLQAGATLTTDPQTAAGLLARHDAVEVPA